MRYIDRGLQQIVERYLKLDARLVLACGARHARVVHTGTKDFVPVAGSAGDWRTRNNLEASLRRLSKTGRGLIAQRSRAAVDDLRFAREVEEVSHA